MLITPSTPGANKWKIVCPYTGETFHGCFEADTDKCYISMFIMKDNRVLFSKSIKLPNGHIVYPWKMERHYRDFDVVDQATGAVVMEARIK